MSKTLSIDLADIKGIVESDWDDKAIRLKIGEFVVQKAADADDEIASLLDVKFVKEADKASDESRGLLARCCRGRV
ncbi:MAG: hypothetical protein K9K86_10205 [Pseudomonadales bacterium]|nr:hypothetical protein [Pseudomonadales bacterium]